MKKERLVIGGICALLLLCSVAQAGPYSETGDPYEQTVWMLFDSLNVRFIGHWPFSSPTAVVYDSARSISFCGSGGGVFVLNVYDPTDPIILSDAIRTRAGYINSMFYLSDRLYIASQLGLYIWDVTDPTSPTKLGFYETHEPAFGVAVFGDYVYLTEMDSGLHVVNVSDPTNPSRESVYYMQNARGVEVSGIYAYVCHSGYGLRVINVSDPANPYEEALCDLPYGPYAVAVSDNYVYVTCLSVLCIVNVSDPANPFVEGSCSIGDDIGRDVKVSGNYAYVANGNDGLRVINVADPANPYEEGFYLAGSTFGVAVSGDYAHVVARASFYVVNISNVSTPSLESRHPIPHMFFTDIACSGDHAYVASWALYVLNVSNPTNPYLAGYWWHWDYLPLGLAVSGDNVYVASNPGGLWVFNVNDPANPIAQGFWSLPYGARDVAVSGSYAYVAANSGGLRVINVSDPANPYEEGFYITPASARDVAVSGSYAYVAANSAGLRVINVSDPANPYEEGFCYTLNPARTVVVSGNYAYVVYEGGLALINVSDPANPFEEGRYDPSGTVIANDVVVSEDYAYMAFGNGLQVINVATPANPFLAGYYETTHTANTVALYGDYAYTGVNQRGLDIYDFLLTSADETEVSSVNAHAMLLQNPMRGEFIELMLHIACDKSLVIGIYDSMGQLLQVVSLTHLTTGRHRIRIPAGALPCGVYFIQLKAGKKTETRKLILLKQ